MKVLIYQQFWSKFLRYTLVGLSISFLALMGQVGVLGDVWHRGPLAALAIEPGQCESGWTFLGGDAGDSNAWVEGCSGGTSSSGNPSDGNKKEEGKKDEQGVAKVEQGPKVAEQGPKVAEQGPTAGLWEGAGCVGQDSVWGLWNPDGSIHTIKANHGNRGECGGAVSKDEQGVAKVEQGPKVAEQGPKVSEQGPTKVERGAIKVEQGPTKVEQGPTRVEQGPTVIAQPGSTGPPGPQGPAGPPGPVGATGGPVTISPTISPTITQNPSITVTQPREVVVREVVVREVRTERVAEVVCPVGTEKRVRDNVVECVVRQVVEQPRVVQAQIKGVSEVKELPRTGLPLLAWGFVSLIPLGSRLRRYKGGETQAVSPHFLWQEREFFKQS